MIISAIVAMDRHNAIGRNNQLPWHLPKDLKFFKNTTMGKPVVMGRKTYESLGKPLKDRLNIVLTHNEDFALPDGVLRYDNVRDALRMLEEKNTEEAFIIGGGKVFDETMKLMNRLFVTHIDTVVTDADAFFPHIDHAVWVKDWEEKHSADEKHAHDFAFCRYERLAL